MDVHQETVLVQQAQKGDKRALITLYQNYLNPIYRYAYSRVSNKSEAEDITSEIFLRMVRHLNEFQSASSFKNWLYGIAKHVIADFWRQHYKNPTDSFDKIPEILTSSPPNQIVNEEAEQDLIQKESRIKKILAQLPDQYRRVLELRFLKSYTLQETANELGISLANTKVIQYRALKKAYLLSKKYE